MIDIHCHILPEVDDGPKSWDVAVEMCRMAADDGIRHIVATPHANGEYPYDRAWLMGVLEHLRELAGSRLKLSLGCDFHFSYDNMQLALEYPERFTIGSTRYLLVEFSDFAIPPATTEQLGLLIARGVTPIITHPERNPILQKEPQRLLEWVGQGCAAQVTASAFTGSWGEAAQRAAHHLAEQQAIHFLATDAHSVEWRPPVLSRGRDALAEVCGAEVALKLVEDNPQAVVENRTLPYFPVISR